MSLIKKCGVCQKKPIRYKLHLSTDIICPYCDYLKHPKNSAHLYLCDIQCDELYWYTVEILSEKNAKHTKVIYCIEKDECCNCGKRDYTDALFEGKCLNIKK